jgi:hypothetical protein
VDPPGQPRQFRHHPLDFANPTDYDQIKDGDVLIVEDIQEVLATETNTVRLRNATRSATYAVKRDLKARQRAIIKAGRRSNETRTGGKAHSPSRRKKCALPCLNMHTRERPERNGTYDGIGSR